MSRAGMHPTTAAGCMEAAATSDHSHGLLLFIPSHLFHDCSLLFIPSHLLNDCLLLLICQRDAEALKQLLVERRSDVALLDGRVAPTNLRGERGGAGRGAEEEKRCEGVKEGEREGQK